MKLIHTLALTFATACLALTGCDKKPGADSGGAAPKVVDEKTAIANFKTEVESVGKWIEEKTKSAGADPAAGAAMVTDIVAKLKGIKTDGLPADLKGAWSEINVVFAEMGTVMASMPKPDPAKPEEMSKVMGDFLPKMMAIQAKVEPAAKKLDEVGKKYGLDMTKVTPGGK